MGFDLGTLLQQHAGHVTAADPDGVGQAFRHVVGEQPHASVALGIAAALRAAETPPFAQMVNQLYVHSDESLRTDLVNLLLDDVSPAMLTALAGSIGDLMGQNGHPRLTAEQVAEIAPAQVAEIAAVAEQHNPGILDRVATLFAKQHDVFGALDSATLKVALSHMAQLH